MQRPQEEFDLNQNKLKESEEKYRTIFNSGNDAFIIINFEGKIVEVNPAACKTYQYTYVEIIGKNVLDLIQADDHAKFAQFRKSVDKKGSYEETTINVRKDGSTFYANVYGSIINLNKKPHLLAIARDISKEKQVEIEKEEALSVLQKRMQEITCLFKVNEVIKDPKTNIPEAMQYICNLIPPGWKYPENTCAEISLNQEVYRSKKYKNSDYSVIEKIILNDCERGYIKVNVYDLDQNQLKPLFLEEEKKLLKSISINISVYISRIENEIELSKTAKNLARSNRELEQFAYVASHDLQEPLRMISSYTQLLERKYKDKLDERANKYIYYAVDGARRMQNLINDLLDFSRVSTKGEKFTKEDSNKVLNEALNNLSMLIKENKVKITKDKLPTLKMDKSQIERVFYNLINNAIKFRKENVNPEIHISALKRDKKWLFSVQDNGIGIEEKFKEKVFIIFQRLHGSDIYKGTGIGLAICKRIINRHGGDIWFESKPNIGTTFYFTISEY